MAYTQGHHCSYLLTSPSPLTSHNMDNTTTAKQSKFTVFLADCLLLCMGLL
jgi:hypothetical protein